MTVDYKFKQLQEVYHITDSNIKGIIIGRRVTTDPFYFAEYKVTLGWEMDDVLWYLENELQVEQNKSKSAGFK